MIVIEGFGGTGKAVVNLLQFATTLARLTQDRVADLNCSVFDQDSAGVWPEIPIDKAVPSATGTFADAFDLQDQARKCAASLFFSPKELSTDLERGFHAQPKLVAELYGLYPPTFATPNAPVHVVVFSDIGGTGAGCGPVRIAQLLAAAEKHHVIAVVLGRYIDVGTPNPLGREYLQRLCNDRGADGPYLSVCYLDVDSQHVTGGTPPSSGLNPAGILARVANTIWEAGCVEQPRLDEEFGLAARGAEGRRGAFISISVADDLPFAGPNGFISKVSSAACADDLGVLTGPTRLYLYKPLQAAIATTPLQRECWTVFGSAVPSTAPVVVPTDLGAAFDDYFAGAADVLATAKWFHRAVADGDPECADAFRRLLRLYLDGRLYLVELPWPPAKSGVVYGLCTAMVDPREPNLKSKLATLLVGAFSSEFPFWTTPEQLPILRSMALSPERHDIVVAIKTPAPSLEACLGHSIASDDAVGLSVEFVEKQSLFPSTWDWLIEQPFADWLAYSNHIDGTPLLRDSIGVQQVEWAIATTESTKVSAFVSLISRTLLPDDGVYSGNARGFGILELRVGDKAATQIYSPNKSGTLVTADISVIFGNILLTKLMATTTPTRRGTQAL